MRQGLRKVALGVVLVSSSAALADDAPDRVSCRVEGYDVALINNGEEALAEGTIIHWSVPFARADGRHELVRPLEPGRLVMIGGALGSSYLDPQTECHVGLEDADP